MNAITYGGQVYKTARHADLKLTLFQLLWRLYWTSEKGYYLYSGDSYKSLGQTE